MSAPDRKPWQDMITVQQRKIFNAACGDLSEQLTWHGFRLSKDDWRHFLSGTILGWRMLPGIDMGTGPAGFVMLGGSSMDLSKEKCIEAITLAFAIGDQPWEYEPSQARPIRWCESVVKARWLTEESA